MDCLHNPYTLNFKSCPTWIRTKTNRTKNCRTTLILSDKQFICVRYRNDVVHI